MEYRVNFLKLSDKKLSIFSYGNLGAQIQVTGFVKCPGFV